MAYAGQEILSVLLPVVGVIAYRQMTYISGIIILLLFILMISYRQTIEHYPNGGGAYIVAKTNLGTIPGVVAGAALAVDYILTVAVSVSSGVQQIASAFGPVAGYTVPICVFLIILMAIGNLRGLREASRIFGIPTYAFIAGMLAMLVAGFIKLAGGYVPPAPVMPTPENLLQPLTAMLMLKAFSNGCAAVTGFEAVSNGVPNFKEPARKNARNVLLILTIIILVLFGGTAVIANLYKVVPDEHNALLILIAGEIFGKGFMYYYVTVTAFIILILAANTAYSGFPMMLSVMARDGYAPRQLSVRGNRLSYSSGIVVLSVMAALLIIAFDARVDLLIGLYAIGVFISFTLSQSGMFVHWVRSHEPRWRLKALVNGFGALVTAAVVVIIALTKFRQGAWIVVILVPILVLLMLKVKKHYTEVHDKLRLEPGDYEKTLKSGAMKVHAVVPLDSVNRASVRALRYAKTISGDIVAFNVACDEETARKTRQKYAQLGTDIPLVTHQSKNRDIVRSIVELIESEEYALPKEDMVAVILPQFITRGPLQRLLHNRTRQQLQRRLLKHRQVVICTIPLQMNT
ncbi:amino acid/polyamine/organocation transporter, APC superfamily (TC 2.A.3) [Sporobacter termitidis DSM 10068]|uniref:Amino acid/polyamine/organocation transporter, APC superfamily (TC 2.A.3) n=1 Tax=Sporobacter termitidis DSM 10068 TaxID=1123282 RepID=A0A1M5XQI2_9FIRM|nr:amino acid/polyamine/organocation transporter, APC superfamily (TC 2.A.3) [Sporobacter termitidis DSM 10068]